MTLHISSHLLLCVIMTGGWLLVPTSTGLAVLDIDLYVLLRMTDVNHRWY